MAEAVLRETEDKARFIYIYGTTRGKTLFPPNPTNLLPATASGLLAAKRYACALQILEIRIYGRRTKTYIF